MPIHGAYIAKGGSYSTTGVFPAIGSYVISDMPEHGFTNLLGAAKTDEMIMINPANSAVIDYHGTFDSNDTAEGRAQYRRANIRFE